MNISKLLKKQNNYFNFVCQRIQIAEEKSNTGHIPNEIER